MLIIIVIFSFCFSLFSFWISFFCLLLNYKLGKTPKLFMQSHKSHHNSFYSWLTRVVWKHNPTTFCWKNIQWRTKKEASIDEHPVHTVSGFSQDSVIQVVYGKGVDLLGINRSIDLGHQDLHLAPVLLNTYPVHIPFPYWGHASASPVIFFFFRWKEILACERVKTTTLASENTWWGHLVSRIPRCAWYA